MGYILLSILRRLLIMNIILFALNKLGKPMYGGTVPYEVVQKRRERNRVARRQRRVNRQNNG